MPRAFRLRKGQTVWLWYGGVVCRGTLERRGVFILKKSWRVRIYASGDVHYAQRRHLHLCEEDARNAL